MGYIKSDRHLIPFWILDFGLRKPHLGLLLSNLSLAFFVQIGTTISERPWLIANGCWLICLFVV
ncbi:hypothetical protein [Scytonema hofmannii]|uniref:hypothetical protein n=1 Tax=Scytonema hofmannii TaxID=34078 RepID=UPI000347F06F|nr:hypothetical protein [Scytonema hofmannii]